MMFRPTTAAATGNCVIFRASLGLAIFVGAAWLTGCGGGSSSDPGPATVTPPPTVSPPPPEPVRFDHSTAFEQLPEDSKHIQEDLLRDDLYLRIPWYLFNYNFAKYVGYQDLLAKYDRHLPAGRGLTVLQAEGWHTPDSAGNVQHLFNNPGSNTHSTDVAGILTHRESYPAVWTRYSTFSLYLDNFHAASTPYLRTFAAGLASGPTYPETNHDGSAMLTPAKLLNVSNSNGGGTETTRHFDKFVEENDLVACTAMSGGIGGNGTTSGNTYNSIAVHHTQAHPAMFEGARVNDHGEPRYKPDIVTRAAISRASSYSAPTVCSAAAMLLERTQVDDGVANAYNGVAVKAILMAGATRFNYRISSYWSDVQEVNEKELISEPLFYWGEWERTSDALPMSPRHGAGHLNVLAAYEILDAGEFDAGTSRMGVRGWDYDEGHAIGDTLLYPISLDREMMFSAVLVWHRYIDDAFASHLPDYEVSVYDDTDTRVAFSDSVTSNVELIEAQLGTGDYRVSIRVKSDGGSTDGLSYGLAWIGKVVLEAPVNVTVSGESATHWNVSWDERPDRKYRVSVGKDAEFSDIDREVFVDGGSYQYAVPDDGASRHFRVYTYPEDGNVAYQYPSAPVTVRSPAQQEAGGTAGITLTEITDSTRALARKGAVTGNPADTGRGAAGGVGINYGWPPADVAPAADGRPLSGAAPVAIPDANLRAAVEAALGKTPGQAIYAEEMATLVALDVRESAVADVTGLEHASRLAHLDLGLDCVADVHPQQTLPDARPRSADAPELSDLSPLAGLTRLERLFLCGNAIEDLTPLSPLTGLTHLDLSDNGIVDLRPLSALTALRRLDIGDNRIADLHPLDALTGLTTLRAAGNRIADLSPLSGLAGLQELDLGSNAVSELGHLAAVSGLKRLRLAGNAIADLTPLSGLVRLQELDLGSSAVIDLYPLSGLTELRKLRLADNAIADLTPLSGLTALAELDLGSILAVDLKLLQALTGLRTLRLTGNGVTDLSPLSGLTDLKELELAENAITELHALAHLTALRRLDLRNNRVEHLDPLDSHESLVWLHVGGNRIADFAPLDGKPGLTVEGRGNQELSAR